VLKNLYKVLLVVLLVGLFIASSLYGCLDNNEQISSNSDFNDNLVAEYGEKNKINIIQKYSDNSYAILLYENSTSYGIDFCEIEKNNKKLTKKSSYYWNKDKNSDFYAKCYSYNYEKEDINVIILIFEDNDLLKKTNTAEFNFEDLTLKSIIDQDNRAYLIRMSKAPKKLVLQSVSLFDENGTLLNK